MDILEVALYSSLSESFNRFASGNKMPTLINSINSMMSKFKSSLKSPVSESLLKFRSKVANSVLTYSSYF